MDFIKPPNDVGTAVAADLIGEKVGDGVTSIVKSVFGSTNDEQESSGGLNALGKLAGNAADFMPNLIGGSKEDGGITLPDLGSDSKEGGGFGDLLNIGK